LNFLGAVSVWSESLLTNRLKHLEIVLFHFIAHQRTKYTTGRGGPTPRVLSRRARTSMDPPRWCCHSWDTRAARLVEFTGDHCTNHENFPTSPGFASGRNSRPMSPRTRVCHCKPLIRLNRRGRSESRFSAARSLLYFARKIAQPTTRRPLHCGISIRPPCWRSAQASVCLRLNLVGAPARPRLQNRVPTGMRWGPWLWR